MLSIGRIGAGSGYRYLTDQVATQDAPRAGENLHSYYQRSGYPPGVWVGNQADAFGLDGTVEVEAVGRLFGRCAHPVTGETLGAKTGDYRTVAKRVADRIATLDHPVTDTERTGLVAEEAQRPNPQPVAGFDLTFSAPKSVSVLWALGGPEIREAVRAAHQAAWRDAFTMFESEVAATRLGHDGIAQVDVTGVSAAAFEHWYSRAGDPQLHTHVAVSAMVATDDGRWRRLDSRALYRAAAVLSERYRAALVVAVANSLGVDWEHRPSRRSDTLLPEIAGVPDDLLRLFSSRQLQVETALTGLADQYTQKHDRSPDRAALARLAQRATLDHRPAPAHRRFADQLQLWSEQAAGLLGCRPDQIAAVLTGRCLNRPQPIPALPRHLVDQHAQDVVARLIETGATWTRWDIRRHASAQLREHGYRADPDTVNRLAAAVLNQPDVFPIGPPEPADTPISLCRLDGSSRFARRGEDRYSTQQIASAEADLVALATTRHLPPAEQARRRRAIYGQLDDDELMTRETASRQHLERLTARCDRLRSDMRRPEREARLAILDAEIAEQHAARTALGRELCTRHTADGRLDLHDYAKGLGVDQVAAVVRLADRSRPLDALVGPAGTGKTTTLRALVRFWHHQQRQVTVLAPTAIAARTSGETLGVAYDTLHAALHRWRRGDDLPQPGDLILIDEASMATTPTLLAAARLAVDRGACVRLVGDPRQLKAVGAGGGLALVAEATHAPELWELHRFEHSWEAQATLGLRRGDPAALDAYFAHDRIHADVDHAAVAATLRAWATSPAGIGDTIMVASDNHTVLQLNTLARTHRVTAGHVSVEGVTLHDDTVAGVGDLVVTRKNQRLPHHPTAGGGFMVRNRDRWRIDAINADHSLLVSRMDRAGSKITLPADYTARHVQLGYADTGHGVQGRTVERAEILVRPGDTRWYLYVAMSRARQSTVAHVIIDQLDHEPLYQPGRTARHILETVLANDEPVSLTERQRHAIAAHANPARLYDRYRHAQTEELRHRLTHALRNLGATHLLHRNDAWQLTSTALAVEQTGLNAPAILTSLPADKPLTVDGLCQQLDNARYHQGDPDGPARPPGGYAGIVARPGAHVDADIARYLDTLGTQLLEWRNQFADQLAARQPPPKWATALGQPPADQEHRRAWAASVAQIALWRACHHQDGPQLLGPKPPSGHHDSPAWNAAARAVAQAQSVSHAADNLGAPDADYPERYAGRAARTSRPRRPV